METDSDLKTQVRDFWDEQSCGEVYAAGASEKDYYEEHGRQRYALEPYLHDFAKFREGRGKDVLEVGVGMGADHLEWARSEPRSLTGVDLTPRAIDHTRKRLEAFGFDSTLSVGDAEKLPFEDDSFDLVYSWGVLHHSPNTPRAIEEVHRVLRPGGVARIMVYHRYSLTGYMLWGRYALLTGKPFRSLDELYAEHLESPGTKAYSVEEGQEMCNRFDRTRVWTQLAFGDLLEGEVGQRHRGPILSLARALWPRWFLKRAFRNHGLYLLIEAAK